MIGVVETQREQAAEANSGRIIECKPMPALFELPGLRRCQKAGPDVLLNLASLKFPF